MSADEPRTRDIAVALRELLLGADRYRHAVADRYQITIPEVITLGDLYQSGPLTPRSIADRLSWTTGGVTSLLDRLERGGYVTRAPNPEDRRSVLIHATDEGQQAMQWAFGLLDTAVEAARDAGPDPEHLVGFLTRTADALRDQAAPDHPPADDDDDE